METTDFVKWISFCLVLFITIYWYLSRCYSYWKRNGIPYVPGIPVFGSQLSVFFKAYHDIEVERYKKYGRVYGHYEGTSPVLNIADPELLKNILVKDFQFFVNRRDLIVGDPITDNMVSVLEGEKWKRVRNIITPAFTTGKIKKMTSIILDSAENVVRNIEKCSKAGDPVDTKKFFGAFTMDVIASTAFATKVDSHNDPNNQFVAAARKAFDRASIFRFLLFYFFPTIYKLFRIPIFDSDSTAFFKRATIRIIEERKKTGQSRKDFLQLLMEAAGLVETPADEKDDQDEENEPKVTVPMGQKGMSNEELVSQCIIFFLGGYHTTATTLSLASYMMALNPDFQERLIEEIDTVLAQHKGNVTYEAIQNMKYLDSIVSETLRMFPTNTFLQRRAGDDYELGDTGFTIPKGMMLAIPVYPIHHDPEFYPEPEKFDPDRFSAESKIERNPYTYLPFGAGLRNCLGMRFALMEMKICLAYVFNQFRFKPCSQTIVPMEYHVGQGLLQPKSIILRAERRTDKV